jgi:hypothetical protein
MNECMRLREENTVLKEENLTLRQEVTRLRLGHWDL